MTSSLTLRLKPVRAEQGLQWVRAGFHVLFRRPFILCGLFCMFFLISMLVSSLVPVIGSMIALSFMPLLTLGFMKASQMVLNGYLPTPSVFMEPLRSDPGRRNRLLQLGGTYALGVSVAFLLSAWLTGDGTGMLQAGDSSTGSMEAALANQQWLAHVALFLFLSALISLPFWHAPALVYWAQQGFAQSLFSSTVACWRARWAFLTYGLAWAGLVIAFGMITSLLLGMLGNAAVMRLALMPAGLIFSTAFYASLYFSFRDSFEAAEPIPTNLT